MVKRAMRCHDFGSGLEESLTESFRRDPGATGQNSCQPEGLQPESAMAALLVLAIERLLPSPGALPSPILAATHTCFIMLGTLRIESLHRVDYRIDLRVGDAKI